MRSSYPKKNYQKPNYQLIIGRKPLIEQLRHDPQKIERIYIGATAHGDEISLILKLAKENGIPFFHTPAPKLQRMTTKNHQGVVACIALIPFWDVEQIIQTIYDKGEIPLLAILGGVQDIGNFGAIARTAWISGFHALIIPYSNTPPIQESAIKASAGALTHIYVCRELSMKKLADKLRLHGIHIYASSLKVTTPLHSIDFSKPAAVVVGGEQAGAPDVLSQEADEEFTIPMQRDMNSYNVSVAFGMIAYCAMMRRLGK